MHRNQVGGMLGRGGLAGTMMLGPLSSQAATFESLGRLPGGFNASEAFGVSADGRTVVGRSASASGPEAFRWTESGGMEPLGDLPGGMFQSNAWGVSADGTTVVGSSESSSGTEAFRWTSAGGMEGLGDPEGGSFHSLGNAASGDGSVVAGWGIGGSGAEGFRWTSSGGFVALEDLPGGRVRTSAMAMSPDAAFVVGESEGEDGVEAALWTAGSVTGLGFLAGGTYSRALDVTPDGSVVVGFSVAQSTQTYKGFRWTEAAGMVDLGNIVPGGDYCWPYAVSADGKTVVGEANSFTDTSGREAFLWDEAGGMRSLKEELESVYGLDLSEWRLQRATGISDDGRTIVGNGYSEVDRAPRAWRAVLSDSPRPATMTWRFSGLLKYKEMEGNPVYAGVEIGEMMEGSFTIPVTDADAVVEEPGIYQFPGSAFFGTLTGDGIETSTEGSLRPLEVHFLDDYLPDVDERNLINACLNANLQVGDRIDLAELETDLATGGHRIEFGVSLGVLGTDWLSDSAYRDFPDLSEVEGALFFVVEEQNDEEILYAVGEITDFERVVYGPIVVVAIHRSADLLTIDFRSDPGVTQWTIHGAATLSGGFPDDLTAVPGTAVVEEAGRPGFYTATVDVAGRGECYFVRIERP